jgi:hypothetical protein
MLEHAWRRGAFFCGHDVQQRFVAHQLFHVSDVAGYEERGRRTVFTDVELRLA